MKLVQLETVKANINQILEAAQDANEHNELKGVFLITFAKDNRARVMADLRDFKGMEQYSLIGLLTQFVQDYTTCIVPDDEDEEYD